jgi:hypothetical protein
MIVTTPESHGRRGDRHVRTEPAGALGHRRGGAPPAERVAPRRPPFPRAAPPPPQPRQDAPGTGTGRTVVVIDMCGEGRGRDEAGTEAGVVQMLGEAISGVTACRLPRDRRRRTVLASGIEVAPSRARELDRPAARRGSTSRCGCEGRARLAALLCEVERASMSSARCMLCTSILAAPSASRVQACRARCKRGVLTQVQPFAGLNRKAPRVAPGAKEEPPDESGG